MRNIHIVIALILISFISLCFEASARLIIRGGATVTPNCCDEVLALGPQSTPRVSPDESSLTLYSVSSDTFYDVLPVPFENSPLTGLPEDACDLTSCEYSFGAGDRLQLQGYSKNFGLNEGVIASHQWAIYDNDFTIELGRWEATSVALFGDLQFDVFLDTLFPIDIVIGVYNLMLMTTYEAPEDLTFGDYFIESSIGGQITNEFVEIGPSLTRSSMHLSLVIESEDILREGAGPIAVSSPQSIILVLLSAVGLIRLSRRSAKPVV
jgi:hypothetical protein